MYYIIISIELIAWISNKAEADQNFTETEHNWRVPADCRYKGYSLTAFLVKQFRILFPSYLVNKEMTIETVKCCNAVTRLYPLPTFVKFTFYRSVM